LGLLHWLSVKKDPCTTEGLSTLDLTLCMSSSWAERIGDAIVMPPRLQQFRGHSLYLYVVYCTISTIHERHQACQNQEMTTRTLILVSGDTTSACALYALSGQLLHRLDKKTEKGFMSILYKTFSAVSCMLITSCLLLNISFLFLFPDTKEEGAWLTCCLRQGSTYTKLAKRC